LLSYIPAAEPVKTAPGSAWDPSVSMAGVFVPGLSPRRLTVDGGLAAASWARQTRVYYFQGKDLVVSVQNVTGWEKPKVL